MMAPEDDSNRRLSIGWYYSDVSYIKAPTASEKRYFLARGSEANISRDCIENYISSVAT
jgi:hypothetical protein